METKIETLLRLLGNHKVTGKISKIKIEIDYSVDDDYDELFKSLQNEDIKFKNHLHDDIVIIKIKN